MVSVQNSTDGSTLDHETQSSLTVHAECFDGVTLESCIPSNVRVTIAVMDVNEPPSTVMMRSGTAVVFHVNEDDEGYSSIAGSRDDLKWWSRPLSPSVDAFDVDAGQRVAFSIKVGHGNTMFQVSGVETTSFDPRIYVKSGVTLDFESRA